MKPGNASSQVDRSADGAAIAPMVELRQVSKRYGEALALDTVDLTVSRGEFVTLLGPSGSGKTTLLNLIAGMTTPSAGRIYIDGRDATSLPPSRRGIGMVFQNYALMPHMTVFENIAFPLRVRRLPRPEIERKVSEVLDLIHLPDIASRKPRELSGGQQQRVSLARCIVYSPSLILLDEPLGALDKKLREQMQLEIKRIHGQLGVTMLNVTHDQDEALTMSDRVVLMNKGRVEQVGAPEELYFRPRSVFAADFIGDANLLSAEITDVRDADISLRAPMLSITAPRPAFVTGRGDKVVVLIRPESLRLSAQDDDAADVPNRVRGTVRDSIVLGGVVKHHVRLEGGADVIVQESNHAARPARNPGEKVTLAWHTSDAVVLLDETRTMEPLP